jgi:hypothetical protein
VSVIQMCVLDLFNRSPTWQFHEIVSALDRSGTRGAGANPDAAQDRSQPESDCVQTLRLELSAALSSLTAEKHPLLLGPEQVSDAVAIWCLPICLLPFLHQ